MAGLHTWLRTDERVPLLTVAWDARAGRRVTAAAIAAAVQGIIYWLILHEAIEPTAVPTSAPIEVTIFTLAKRPRPLPPPREVRHPAVLRQVPPQKEPSPAEIPLPQPITVPGPAQPAAHAPIDWRRAMQREIRAQESGSAANKLQFGFPEPPPSESTVSPEFGWDYAHTHRIVPLPHGGMIINFSDRCSINVWLPIPMCRFGKLSVDGHLFDHLHERRPRLPGDLP